MNWSKTAFSSGQVLYRAPNVPSVYVSWRCEKCAMKRSTSRAVLSRKVDVTSATASGVAWLVSRTGSAGEANLARDAGPAGEAAAVPVAAAAPSAVSAAAAPPVSVALRDKWGMRASWVHLTFQAYVQTLDASSVGRLDRDDQPAALAQRGRKPGVDPLRRRTAQAPAGPRHGHAAAHRALPLRVRGDERDVRGGRAHADDERTRRVRQRVAVAAVARGRQARTARLGPSLDLSHQRPHHPRHAHRRGYGGRRRDGSAAPGSRTRTRDRRAGTRSTPAPDRHRRPHSGEPLGVRRPPGRRVAPSFAGCPQSPVGLNPARPATEDRARRS